MMKIPLREEREESIIANQTQDTKKGLSLQLKCVFITQSLFKWLIRHIPSSYLSIGWTIGPLNTPARIILPV